MSSLIILHHADNMKAEFPLWYMRKKLFGISPESKLCSSYTTVYQGNKLIENSDSFLTDREFSFSRSSLTAENAVNIYNKIAEFAPEWMIMQPGILSLLIDIAQDNGLKPISSVKYIEFTGEMLSPSARKRAEDFFGCKTANQYGCNEAGSIAFECENGKLHINDANAFVEILSDGKPVKDGEYGIVYITTLHNRAMPVIRYNTGDIGGIYEEKCGCSCKGKILEIDKGRVFDLIAVDNGIGIPSSVFSYPIEYINDKIGAIIRQYQIIQTDYRKFTVKMALAESYFGWCDTVGEEFVAHLRNDYLKSAEYNFEFTTSMLSEENAGKHRIFIKEDFSGGKNND